MKIFGMKFEQWGPLAAFAGLGWYLFMGDKGRKATPPLSTDGNPQPGALPFLGNEVNTDSPSSMVRYTVTPLIVTDPNSSAGNGSWSEEPSLLTGLFCLTLDSTGKGELINGSVLKAMLNSMGAQKVNLSVPSGSVAGMLDVAEWMSTPGKKEFGRMNPCTVGG